jgi:hypothetical protein
VDTIIRFYIGLAIGDKMAVSTCHAYYHSIGPIPNSIKLCFVKGVLWPAPPEQVILEGEQFCGRDNEAKEKLPNRKFLFEGGPIDSDSSVHCLFARQHRTMLSLLYVIARQHRATLSLEHGIL